MKVWRKRIICLLLVLIVCLAQIPGPVRAATGGKTQADAVGWANGHAAAHSALDYDGAYGVQCVDLIKYYYVFLGNNAVQGNGKDYATNSLPSGWTRIQYGSGFTPQPGDVAVWTTGGGGNGHVAIVVSGDASSMTVVEQNYSAKYCTTRSGVATSGIWGVIRPDFSQNSSGGGGGSAPGSNPKGVWDDVSGGQNCVYVRGWAYDPDDLNAALDIHVYVGGVHRGTLKANSGRPDVGSREGCGDFHGFEGTITLDAGITGSQTVEIFALNVGGGGNSSLGTKTVTINGSGSPTPTPIPTPSANDPVGNCEKLSGGVLSVSMTGWAYDPDVTSRPVTIYVTVQGEHVGSLTADKHRIDVSEATGAGLYHGFEGTLRVPPHLTGSLYVAVYAMDLNGGNTIALTGQIVDIKPDTTAPVITNVKVTERDNKGYTVTCTVTDDCGVDRVQFPTWTLANGQDDIIPDWNVNPAARGTQNGNTYTYRVNTSSHNNEVGSYNTHIYAFDKSGNYSTASTHTVTVPAAAKSVSLNTATLNFDTLGTTKTLTASVLPSDALQNITWSVNNTSVATVSSSGIVTAVGYGSAVVTATAHNGVSASCAVTVERPTLTGISVAAMPTKTVYTVGDSLDPTGLILTAVYSNRTETTVTEGYTCTPDILHTVGTQTITVTYAGFSTTFQVTVEPHPVVAEGYSDNTIWTLTDNGVLTFSGEGKMKNYEYKSEMPWYPYFDQITTVVLEEGVTSIGDYAFYGMPELLMISIPESVTTIGNYAFKNCPVLDNVVLPGQLNKLGESAFYACTGLTSIEIPASLWTVQPYTFKNCTALAEITFHEGNLMKISDGAFYNTAVTELELPDCLSILDVYSFKNCAKLESITLGSGLTQIREAVFYSTAIPTIVIPEGITSIGPYAFKNCVELETIDLPESLTSVGEASFYACTALESLELPDAVTKIGNYAFRKCADLQTVTFSDSLVDIGESSFYGCESLFYLDIPENVTTIQGYAFKGCTNLGIVVLPNSLKTLGDSAFHTCTGLDEIVIPGGVTKVGEYCFSGSTGIDYIYFLGNAPTIGSGAFNKITATAYYPSGNATWTSAVRQNYGGTITWTAQ